MGRGADAGEQRISANSGRASFGWAAGLLAVSIALVTSIWVVVPPVKAVIIDSGDGTGNTAAPPSDPGFAHVGRRSSTTAVYLGNG
ncbi:MAG: hypothetical protein MJE66_13240, partial [Proteobacteria bacterium]|nr:hypothetical protein [Pseudomonadota bacterium]